MVLPAQIAGDQMEISESLFQKFLEKKLGPQYERALQEFRRWHPFWRVDIWNTLTVVARHSYPTEEMRTDCIDTILEEFEKYPQKNMVADFETLQYFNITVPVLLKKILSPPVIKTGKFDRAPS